MKALRTSLFLTVFGLLLFSCTYFEKDPIIIPVPDETEDLEVAFVETPPSSVNNPYWTSISDFTRISISDQTLNQVDGNDGVQWHRETADVDFVDAVFSQDPLGRCDQVRCRVDRGVLAIGCRHQEGVRPIGQRFAQ